MKFKSSYIFNFRFISTVIGFVAASLLVFHTISESTKFTYAQCQSNVKVVAQHLERLTQQSARVVKGVAAWLAANPRADFSSDASLLALSPVLNMDPEDSYAIAIIEGNGQAWLLDEKYAGRSFDVSKRPYFENMRLMEVGKLGFGSRSNNINTGQDTISVNYKVMFNNNPIVISTAFSVNRVEAFLNSILDNSTLSLLLYNNDHLEVFASNNGKNDNLAHQSKPNYTEYHNSSMLPTLATISCSQNVPDSKFTVVATADPYNVYRQSIPMILVIFTLTILAATTNFLSHKRINRLVSKYRRNIENTPLGCISWDKEFHCTEWNKSAEAIFGYTANEAIGCHAAEIIVPSEIKDEINHIYISLLEQKGGTRSTNDNLTKDGRTIICDWYNTPILDANGQVTGVYSLIQDVTEAKTMEENLNNALVDAERANQAKSEFLASMSHELRTPMNAVLGYAQMLQYSQDAPLSFVQKDYVESILSGGQKLLHLINEVLDLSVVEADQMELTLEDVNVAGTITKAISMILPLAGDRGIEINHQIEVDNPSTVRTDRFRFEQALINFLANAVKYNKDNGAITVKHHETEDGYCHIAISDTGIGINKKDYDSVFQMFNRIGADAHLAREGTGIGLTVTKILIEKMAGRVGFESELDIGSTFWLEIPLASNRKALIWSEHLRIGVDAIDKDHQWVVQLLNKLSYISINDRELNNVIHELLDYTKYHFRREEIIMAVSGYPDIKEHQERHRKLIDHMNELSDAWRKKNNLDTLHDLRQFLRDWWIGHIVNVDTGITQYTVGKEALIKEALEGLD